MKVRKIFPIGIFLILAFNFCISSFLYADQSESEESPAQESKTYQGTVSDMNGNPLPGVTVMLKGTQKGTITNNGGYYSIAAEQGQTLVFSFIGYYSVEKVLSEELILNIQMNEDIVDLEEIVVVGYGITRKQDLTGATTNLSSKDLNQGAVTNPLQQLSGRAAGVNITQIGNEPGATPTVRIRGITSLIGGNDPLVVVDGIQGNMDLLNQVPPSEIKSVDILKDASATAIYGSRGAPGVIIVTTKKSMKGKTTAEYSGTVSIDFLANQLEMLNAREWREQAKIWGVSPSADHGSETDWYDILTRVGKTQNHTLSFGGMKGNLNYRASVTGILQDGVVINSDMSNYIARIQATQKALNDRLTFTLNINNSLMKENWSPGEVGRAAFKSNLISNAYVSKPTDPVFFEDGSYYSDEDVFQYINPYAVAKEVINEKEIHNQFGSFRTDLELLKGFHAEWFVSWRKIDKASGYYAPSKSTLPSAIDNEGIANVNTDLTDEKLMDISLKYNNSFGKHKLGGVFVYEWQQQAYQGHFAQARGFINDLTTYNALQLGTIDDVIQGDITSYKNDRILVSFLGRINYSYDDKYLLTASIRQDGSSVFGEDHKWGTFPSASLAWRLSEEDFIRELGFISNLKLRVGYGITGNQQGLSPQQSLQLVSSSGTTYFNGELINNFRVSQNGNPDLRWETRYQANVGLDFGFFNRNLNGSIDAYYATTENLLFNYTVPQPPYPYGTMTANVGSIMNKGFELSLDARIINTKDITLILGGNVSFIHNEVLELGGLINGVEVVTDYVSWGYNSYLIEGKPIGTFNILESDGKNSSNEEVVVDRNSDGTIDQGDQSEDRYFAGSALPTCTYAFTPVFRYKNLDVSMVWRGSGGNKIYNKINKDFSLFEGLGKSNLLKSAIDLGLYTSDYGSDLWLEDGAYLRFENLTIGYTVPIPEDMKYIHSIRLSLTGNNLAVFTKYSGLDPELNLSGENGSGYDAGIYPRTRSFSFGVNVTF